MCIDCRVEKPLKEFPIHSGEFRRTRCQPCFTVYNTARKKDNYDPKKNRVANLKKYNMTIEQYDEMYSRQDSRCAICGKEETRSRGGKVSSLAIDHDHACCPGSGSCGNCIRGLLCYRCNMMIGFARDNIVHLKLGIDYLVNYMEGDTT